MVFMNIIYYFFGLGGGLLLSGGIFLLMMQAVVRHWEDRYRDPFTRPVLRPAGFSCQQRREAAIDNATEWCGGFFCALMFGIGFLAAKGFPPIAWPFFGLFSAIAGYVCGRNMQHYLNESRRLRLGFLGEVAVAEELAKLPNQEWQVFHDVPMRSEDGKEFNIDHVVIGPPAIFAIETKAWSKFRLRMKKDYRLRVEGDEVIFPDEQRKEAPLKQAKGAAASLSVWLTHKTGEKPWVHPQVVTPGWAMSYSGQQNKQICEVNCLRAFLQQTEGELSAERRSEMAAALDEKCRTLTFEKTGNFLSTYSHHAPPASGATSSQPTAAKTPAANAQGV